jgi:hypothetical protein
MFDFAEFPIWVKDGCGQQAGGTADLPPAPEIAGAFRHLRFGPRLCENSEVRSATRMIFLISISKLNALAMWAHEKALNE